MTRRCRSKTACCLPPRCAKPACLTRCTCTREGRPVSAHGGLVLLSGYQANPAINVSFTNSDKPWPQAPLVVPAAQNHSQLIAYGFTIPAPNDWAGVTLEIRGLPDKDGKQVA